MKKLNFFSIPDRLYLFGFRKNTIPRLYILFLVDKSMT